MGASKLGALLVREGLLTEQDRHTILKTCGQRSWAFAKAILSTGMLDEDELAAFCAEHTQYEVAPRNFIHNIDRDILERVDPKVIARLEILPVKIDWEKIQVAVVDPLDISTLRQLEFFTGLIPTPVIAPITEIYHGIKKLIPDFVPHDTALTSFLENHANNAWQKQRLEEQLSDPNSQLPIIKKDQINLTSSKDSSESQEGKKLTAANQDEAQGTDSALVDDEFEIDINQDDTEESTEPHAAPEFTGDEFRSDDDIEIESPTIRDLEDHTQNEPEIDLSHSSEYEDLSSQAEVENSPLTEPEPEIPNTTEDDASSLAVDEKGDTVINHRDDSDGYDLFNFSKQAESEPTPSTQQSSPTDPHKSKSYMNNMQPSKSEALTPADPLTSARINQAIMKISLTTRQDKAIQIVTELFLKICSSGMVIEKTGEEFSTLFYWGIPSLDTLKLNTDQITELNSKISASTTAMQSHLSLNPDFFFDIKHGYSYSQTDDQNIILIANLEQLSPTITELTGELLKALMRFDRAG